ncbi:ubiquinone/menaquinone biosynthesis methyltransferase [Persephonella sp.]
MEDQKGDKVIKTFDSIADRYILANHLLSFWQDVCWRRNFFEYLSESLEGNEIFLDIATGTGESFKYCHCNFKIKVGLDPSKRMLNIAKKRFSDVIFLEGMAEELPIKDSTVDLVAVSFGVRNFEDRIRAFAEFSRVLKTGGVLGILEFFPMENGSFINKAASMYIHHIIPYLGGAITGNFKAYRYLSTSIKNFILPGMMKIELESKGFKVVKIDKLFPNVYTFVAKKV